jgi:hypothetical protein
MAARGSQIPTPNRKSVPLKMLAEDGHSGPPSPTKAGGGFGYQQPNLKAYGAGGMSQPPMAQPIRDIRMETAKGVTMGMGDVTMATGRGVTSSKRTGPNLQLWERELVASPEVKRKATVAQLCESTVL